MIQRLLAIILGVTLMAPDPSSAADDGPVYEILDFDVLDGWAEDDHGAALTAFLETCRDLKDPDWRALCRAARDDPDPRAFFELFFRPVRITHGAGEGTDKALFTGYFEPEAGWCAASRRQVSLAGLQDASRSACGGPMADAARYPDIRCHGGTRVGDCLGR